MARIKKRIHVLTYFSTHDCRWNVDTRHLFLVRFRCSHVLGEDANWDKDEKRGANCKAVPTRRWLQLRLRCKFQHVVPQKGYSLCYFVILHYYVW